MRLASSFAALACALALCPTHAYARQQGQRQAAPPTAEQARPRHVNPMPFIELAEKGRMMAEAGRIGWDSTLDMSATVELNEDGSFKPEAVKVQWRDAGDKDVVEFAQQFVTAVSQSKVLAALRGSAKTVRFTARLDRQNVTLGLETELASEPEATQLATGYGMLVALARQKKAGTAEGTLYEALKITSDGKLFRLSFELPKETVAKTVAEMLDRRAAPNRE